MKIDRLLSLVFYLLNHELVSAGELARIYGVSVRTIQRDLDTLGLAGIPLYSVQGAGGGYGILESYKLDRQLMTSEDFYYILTALESVGATLSDRSVTSTLEKMKTLVPGSSRDLFSQKNEKLSIDFSLLGGDPRMKASFQTIRQAVDQERLIRFTYTSNKLEASDREVEPMTISFHWRSWYLYGYCRLRQGYRLFRISRIKDPEVLDERFHRRDKSFAAFMEETRTRPQTGLVRLTLKFSPAMKGMVEEYYEEKDVRPLPDGSLEVKTEMEDQGWLYGYILSFGPYVEVLDPPEVRAAIREGAEKIIRLYDKK